MRFLNLWVVCWLSFLCSISCISHTPSTFQYVGPVMSVGVPLKVIPVYIDKNFGEADKVAIEDAITQWNYALNGNIVLKVSDIPFDMQVDIIRQCLSGDCWMLIRVDSNNILVPSTNDGSFVLAWANEIGGNHIYFVRDRIYNEWMTGVTLHEMGHLLGAKHDDVYLMKAKFDWENTRCVDYQAVFEVAQYYGFNPQSVRYCTYTSMLRK